MQKIFVVGVMSARGLHLKCSSCISQGVALTCILCAFCARSVFFPTYTCLPVLIVFLGGEGERGCGPFALNVVSAYLMKSGRSTKMLSVFPKVKEALTAAALLDTCAHVLQC